MNIFALSSALLISVLVVSPKEIHITKTVVGTEATAYVSQTQGVPQDSSVAEQRVKMILEREGISWEQANKIIQCESRWNPLAVNTHNKDGSVDKGLWQINSIHGLSDEEVFDPVRSTEFAVSLYKKFGWSPWVCKTS